MNSPYKSKASHNENVVWHEQNVSKVERGEQKCQAPTLLWFTGLSGSGKSTIANALERKLFEAGYHSYLLDGDNVRHGLCNDLAFSEADRVENIRRVGEVGKLFVDAGVIVLTAFISPFKSDREQARALLGEREFIEVYIDTPFAICEQRDPKGLYKKARAGDIAEFTGINSPYEKPDNPEIRIDTSSETVDKSTDKILHYLRQREYLK